MKKAIAVITLLFCAACAPVAPTNDTPLSAKIIETDHNTTPPAAPTNNSVTYETPIEFEEPAGESLYAEEDPVLVSPPERPDPIPAGEPVSAPLAPEYAHLLDPDPEWTDYIASVNNTLHGYMAFDPEVPEMLYYRNKNDNNNIYVKTVSDEGQGVKFADANEYGFLHSISADGGYVYFVSNYSAPSGSPGTDGGNPPAAYRLSSASANTDEQPAIVVSGIGDNFFAADGKLIYTKSSGGSDAGGDTLVIDYINDGTVKQIDGFAMHVSYANGAVLYDNGNEIKLYDERTDSIALSFPMPKPGINSLFRYGNYIIYTYRHGGTENPGEVVTGVAYIDMADMTETVVREVTFMREIPEGTSLEQFYLEDKQQIIPSANLSNGKLLFFICEASGEDALTDSNATAVDVYDRRTLVAYDFNERSTIDVVRYSSAGPFDVNIPGCIFYSAPGGLYEFIAEGTNVRVDTGE
jgi:hypothetical protein